MYVNLTVRDDTGRMNTSPVTTMTPIVRLKFGCNHTIFIPVTDADNDEVRCRWATGYGECGGICGGNGIPNAWMHARECKITYSATEYTGFYAAPVMIEDFATPTATQALSSIPLQFLVYVFKSNEGCDERPNFTKETRAEGSCIGIPPGGTYFDRIIVRAGGPSKSIVEITTSSPTGFIKSPVAQNAPQESYVNVTWTPTTSQIEAKLFCFTGLENSGITTDQRCVTLLVGVAPPQIVSLSPTGEVLPDTQQWIITFDKQFVRPTRSSYIQIHRSDGKVVFSVDVAITAAVLYPVGSLGRTIEFTTSVGFTEKEMYYVTMDPGVAKGVSHCGAESPSIRDPNTWSIKISKDFLYICSYMSPFTASKFNNHLVCIISLTVLAEWSHDARVKGEGRKTYCCPHRAACCFCVDILT
ncbi:PREDICTED: uncharacterized protein LOC107341958 [Acropora digitifera]|uniref:uncharacterized protein LOC107341958 n=1 Tax=Acropora digitifera TaxID=70779 RepID=UPI00077A9493|nr:PREDICTED: uncharacterized protein LOC107341958 [Acropora digitifera]